jgi:hypothetical protein
MFYVVAPHVRTAFPAAIVSMYESDPVPLIVPITVPFKVRLQAGIVEYWIVTLFLVIQVGIDVKLPCVVGVTGVPPSGSAPVVSLSIPMSL